MSNIPAELMQQFLRVDKRYSINPNEEPFFDMPTSLNLEKLVYEQPTAEEISAAAEAKLLIDYNKSKNKINETYTKTMDKIAVRKTAAQNDTLVAKQKVDDNLAVKKGGNFRRNAVARSCQEFGFRGSGFQGGIGRAVSQGRT